MRFRKERNEMGLDLIIICAGILLAILYRNRDQVTGAVRLPGWLWKGIGIFLLIMLLRHLKDVVKFTSNEADQWWPIIYHNAVKLAEILRNFIKSLIGVTHN